LALVAIHFYLIAFPQVNPEFACTDAAKYFLSPEHNKVLLDQFLQLPGQHLGIAIINIRFRAMFPWC